MCRIYSVVAILSLVATASAQPGNAEKPEAELHGSWVVTSSEAKKGADGEWQDVDLRWSWKFKPDGKALLTDCQQGKQSLFRYEADASTEPHRLEIVCLSPAELKGTRQLGIWKLQNSKLTMHLTPPGVDEYPTRFRGPQQEGFYLELTDAQALGLQP